MRSHAPTAPSKIVPTSLADLADFGGGLGTSMIGAGCAGTRDGDRVPARESERDVTSRDRGVGSRHRKTRVRSESRPIGSAGATPGEKRLDAPGLGGGGGLEVLGDEGSNKSSPISDRFEQSRGDDASLDGSLVEELLFDDACDA